MSLNKIILKYVGISLVLVLGFSCSEEKDQGDIANCNLAQVDVLSYYKDLQTQRILESVQALEDCEQSLSKFKSTGLMADLDALQLTFVEAYKANQSLGALDYGPLLVNGKSYLESVDTYPTNREAVKENALQGEENVASLFRSSVGFPAVELILFDAEALFDKGLDALKDSAVQTHLESQIQFVKQALSQALIEYQGDYGELFVQNTGSSDGSSLSLMVNDFVYDFEATLRNFKLRIPAGKFSAQPLPEKSSGYYAEIGLDLIESQLLYLQSFYADDEASQPDLGAYLRCLGEADLDANIQSQFDVILELTQELKLQWGANLTMAIEQDANKVDELINECQQMIPLLKGNLTNSLGVRIAYTDSDGD